MPNKPVIVVEQLNQCRNRFLGVRSKVCEAFGCDRTVPQESNHHPVLKCITFVLRTVCVGLVLYELFK
jgi:hypothetical protein